MKLSEIWQMFGRLLFKIPKSQNMKKNVDSLGVLVDKGLHNTLAASGLNAFKGVLVVMKGIRKKNLFYLYCSTVIGRVRVPSNMSDIDDDIS